MRDWRLSLGLSALAWAVLAGCGGSSAPTAASTTTTDQNVTNGTLVIIGGAQYDGPSNLARWESQAKARPNDAMAQLQAGVAAEVNEDIQAAYNYYNAAIALNTHYGQAYVNMGNLYRVYLKDPASAISWYQKAIAADPSYDYGWFDLAFTQKQQGDTAGAQATAKQALSVIPATDKLYSSLQQMAG